MQTDIINPTILKNIQINVIEDKELMLQYTRGLMFGSDTPELRTYWTIVHLWVSKHLLDKNDIEEVDEAIS